VNRNVFKKIAYHAQKVYTEHAKKSKDAFVGKKVMYSESGNLLIKETLSELSPKLISRFGTTESSFIIEYLKKLGRNIESEKVAQDLWNLSGVFPLNKETLDAFFCEYQNALSFIDICGVRCGSEEFAFWEQEELMTSMLRKECSIVDIELLFPLKMENPWTNALKDKKVLIIHPFIDSMSKQFNIRDKLFKNEDFLPEFTPIWVKAPQTLRQVSKMAQDDWMVRLNELDELIMKIEFDVALIGCGAYGLPIAKRVKQSGKTAIHIGGALQLFFGIRGNRWVKLLESAHSQINIEHWTWPSSEETPPEAHEIERAAYWAPTN